MGDALAYFQEVFVKSIKVFAACIMIIQGLYAPASGQFENAVWDTLTADTVQDAITLKSIAVNGYEEFHLAYAKQRPGIGWDIYYRFVDVYGYMYPERIAESDMPCFHPAIASRYSDNDYDIMIVFESGEDIWGCINHDRFEPWDFANVTNSPDPDLSPSIAFGSNCAHGTWITRVNSEYKIAYLKGCGDSISIEILNASELGPYGAGAEPFITAVGDEPHIFYRGVNGVNYHIHHAYKVHPDSDWTIEYVMTPNADDYTVSAAVNIVGDIFLAISGNGGFGFPGRVYFTYRDRDTGQWSTPQLVTGSNSATNASIALGFGNRAFIASCGVSGNIYDGNVYLSSDTSGSFETSLLGSYISVTRAVVANIISEFGVVIFDAPIGGDQESNIELVYYGPDIPSTGIDRTVPAPSNPSYCYPNPFNAQTVINYSLPEEAFISITIYNINGQKLEVIFDGKDPAGEHSVRWDASDYPSGIYFAQLKSGNRSENIKMVLLK
jgi:hypothetical protein